VKDLAAPDTHVFARIYTHTPLWDYGDVARQAIGALLRDEIGRGGELTLRGNTFVSPTDEPLIPDRLATFLTDLSAGNVESFAVFRRLSDAAAVEDVFPFFLRIDREQHWGVYYKHKAFHEWGRHHLRVGGGECIELALSRRDSANGDRAARVLEICRALFIGSGALYGYVSYGTIGDVFQRVSPLERELELFRQLKERPWIDEYESRVAGVFQGNLFGRSLVARIALHEVPASLWEREDLGEHGLMIQLRAGVSESSGLWESSMDRSLGPLLPSANAQRQPLPARQRHALLISVDAVRRLGGAKLIAAQFPADQVLLLRDGGAVLIKEVVHEFDDYTLKQFLWPLRPGRQSPGYVQLPQLETVLDVAGEISDPVSYVRVRVSADDLGSDDGVALHVECGGVKAERAAAAVRDVLIELLGEFGSVDLSRKRRACSGRVWMKAIDPETVFTGIARIRALSVLESFPFVFFMGDVERESVRLSRGFLKGKGYYVDL